MKSRFSSEFFANNRLRLRELFTGTAPIVLTASGLMQRSGDVAYAYSQDANFWYLTGINQPDMVLVMDKDQDYLIIPRKTAIQETFDGKLDKKNLSNISGIKDIRDQDEGWEKLKKRLKKVKHVATLAVPPAYLEHYGMYVNPARAALVSRLHEIKPDIELLDLSTHITRMRMIKQLPEIETIQDAIDCTTATLKEVLKPAKLNKYK
ncbi:MAG: aminopeptidase P N-terminal domain-containing protein, partial [Candidatus Saccharimonadales bacterium]